MGVADHGALIKLAAIRLQANPSMSNSKYVVRLHNSTHTSQVSQLAFKRRSFVSNSV